MIQSEAGLHRRAPRAALEQVCLPSAQLVRPTYVPIILLSKLLTSSKIIKRDPNKAVCLAMRVVYHCALIIKRANQYNQLHVRNVQSVHINEGFMCKVALLSNSLPYMYHYHAKCSYY